MGITSRLPYALVRPPSDGESGYIFGVFLMAPDAEEAREAILGVDSAVVVKLAKPVAVTVEAP